MANGIEINAKTAASFLENDYELKKSFPINPCLIKELLFLIHGEDKIIIFGSITPIIVNYKGNRKLLLQYLELLNGSQSVESLQKMISPGEREEFYYLLALLFRYGLIYEGSNQLDEEGNHLHSYFSRFINITRQNKNPSEALSRIKGCSLGIQVPPESEKEVQGVITQFPFLNYTFLRDEDDVRSEQSFAVVVCNGNIEVSKVLDSLWKNRIPYLSIVIGDDFVHVGPLTIPGKTASHVCAKIQAQSINPSKNINHIIFWSTYGLHIASSIVAGIAQENYLNRIRIVSNKFYYEPEVKIVAPIPGAHFSGIDQCFRLDIESDGFRIWKHHVSTRFPPKRFLGLSSHLRHYSAENLVKYSSLVPRDYSDNIIALPDDLEISTRFPWLDENPLEFLPFDVNPVSTLLQVAVGELKNASERRRISPSGGGLKSAGMYIHSNGVAELEDGWYSYDSHGHALVRVDTNQRNNLINTLLPFDPKSKALTIIVVSLVQRVREKYGDFAYNIVNLDAGVSTGYALLMAKIYGWKVQHHPAFSSIALAQALGIDSGRGVRTISNIMTFCENVNSSLESDSLHLSDLFKASSFISPASVLEKAFSNEEELPFLRSQSGDATFAEIVKSRRAIREYDQSVPIPFGLISDLLVLSKMILNDIIKSQWLYIPVEFFVLRSVGDDLLDSGVYKADLSRNRKSMLFRLNDAPGHFKECVNQDSLGLSPLILIISVDIEQMLKIAGPAGYRIVLNQCGIITSHWWLAVQSVGFAGTTFGGVLEEEFLRLTLGNSFNQASLFGFACGKKSNS